MPRLPRNLHLVATWRTPANAIRKTRNTTHLKCCACYAKWRWTRPKCCACHENCNASSENVAKVLRLPKTEAFGAFSDKRIISKKKPTYQWNRQGFRASVSFTLALHPHHLIPWSKASKTKRYMRYDLVSRCDALSVKTPAIWKKVAVPLFKNFALCIAWSRARTVAFKPENTVHVRNTPAKNTNDKLLCPLRSFTLETSIAVFQGRLAALKGGAEKNQNACCVSWRSGSIFPSHGPIPKAGWSIADSISVQGAIHGRAVGSARPAAADLNEWLKPTASFQTKFEISNPRRYLSIKLWS